jgi:uncharacterized membrane protein YozB (DUF420 family)
MEQGEQIVSLVFLLQAIATAFLWSLDALSRVSEGTFAVFLAVDLLCFAMISHVYRMQRWGRLPSKLWLLVASIGLAILILSGLLFS